MVVAEVKHCSFISKHICCSATVGWGSFGSQEPKRVCSDLVRVCLGMRVDAGVCERFASSNML